MFFDYSFEPITGCHKSEEALSFFNVNNMNHLKIAEVSILFYVQNHMGHGEHSNLLYLDSLIRSIQILAEIIKHQSFLLEITRHCFNFVGLLKSIPVFTGTRVPCDFCPHVHLFFHIHSFHLKTKSKNPFHTLT
jgi:hypothetical protein